MPGIMAGMNRKDSSALIVVSGSDMCKARLAGLLPRYVCSLWWSARCAPVCCQAQDAGHHGLCLRITEILGLSGR